MLGPYRTKTEEARSPFAPSWRLAELAEYDHADLEVAYNRSLNYQRISR